LNDKRYLTADDYLRDIWRLAAAVRATDWKPDLLLALWRGGAPVGAAVQEFFRMTGWGDVRHLPLACSSYTGIGANAGEVVFSCADEVFASIAPGAKVLAVDDVFDTGKTAAALTEKVASRGAEARFACVYFKPAKNRTALRPDWFVHEADTSWIVFPHEIEGLTPDEIAFKDPELAESLKRQDRGERVS